MFPLCNSLCMTLCFESCSWIFSIYIIVYTENSNAAEQLCHRFCRAISPMQIRNVPAAIIAKETAHFPPLLNP